MDGTARARDGDVVRWVWRQMVLERQGELPHAKLYVGCSLIGVLLEIRGELALFR